MNALDYVQIIVCDAGPEYPDIKTKVKVSFPDGQCRYFTFTNNTPVQTARSIVIDAISEEMKNYRRGY